MVDGAIELLFSLENNGSRERKLKSSMQSAPEINAIIPVINFCFEESPILRSFFGKIAPSIPSRFKRFIRLLKKRSPEFAESFLLVFSIRISFEFKFKPFVFLLFVFRRKNNNRFKRLFHFAWP